MATVFVRHRVADYDRWKQGYDSWQSVRKERGVKGDGVYRSEDDPNDITVYEEFDTMEAAKSFASQDDLKQQMVEIGVQGTPEVWFANRV